VFFELIHAVLNAFDKLFPMHDPLEIDLKDLLAMAGSVQAELYLRVDEFLINDAHKIAYCRALSLGRGCLLVFIASCGCGTSLLLDEQVLNIELEANKQLCDLVLADVENTLLFVA